MRFVAFVVLVLMSFVAPTHADSPEINLGYFNKLAVNGYDVMTYWRGGKPQEGKAWHQRSLEVLARIREAG